MDDDRVWDFEKRLWTGDAAHYEACVADDCLMALPAQPFLFSGDAAIRKVQETPRWQSVDFEDGRIARPEEGLIVLAYHARASREGAAPYEAYCTSTLRRLGNEDWRVVQHQQTVPLKAEPG